MVPTSHQKQLLQIILFATCKIFAEYTPSPGICYAGCENSTDCLCRGSTYATLPQDLSPNIKKLSFHDSLIKQFRKKDAERYPNLEEFSYMAYVRTKDQRSEPKFDADFFLAFPKLRALNLYDCIATRGQKLVFPNTLQKLILWNMDLVNDNLDLSYLTKLYDLSLVGNLLTTIPPLNKKAPLEIIEIHKNPITSIPTKMLWSFCKLRKLKMDETQVLQKYFQDECECRRFQEIVNRQNLLQTDGWKPNCPITCGEIMTPEMKADYNACMNIVEENESESKSRLKIIIVLVAATSIFLILVITAVAYFIKKRRSAKETEIETVDE